MQHKWCEDDEVTHIEDDLFSLFPALDDDPFAVVDFNHRAAYARMIASGEYIPGGARAACEEDEAKSMTEIELNEALGFRPPHLDEDEDALCAELYAEREDYDDPYRLFLDDTVDDAHYNAYLDWIYTPKADEY